MATNITTFFRVLSAPSSSAPSAAPSVSPEVENLARLPAGLWALIIVVLSAALSGMFWVFLKKKKGGEPKKTEEILLRDLIAAAPIGPAPTPQIALTVLWLRDMQAGRARPLPILVEPTSDNVALPADTQAGDVMFIPVPPGYALPSLPPPPVPPLSPSPAPAARRRSWWRDPAAISGATTAIRNGSHGAEKLFNSLEPTVVTAVAPAA
ncbi:uncharacterized protein N7459_004226 [Penicillium hispanicum]|uniref:uncharacterized protein n=1 Tax=Penicillium hispanicum TaxID=1080232 RepID=UPI002540E878|nr:uncharacterized protein N7459_004226 [Penicillium hispanicum]KAJ5584426.1 hypothetical protein N7459_004226 [Penicillium hispanicum]